MPKLWSETIAAHREDVRTAVFEAAVALANEGGATALTMSAIAERTGVTRATLYKYFADVDAILVAWHEQQVAGNLAELAAARDEEGAPVEQLTRILETYARLVHRQHGSELLAFSRIGDAATEGYRRLAEMLREAIAEGARRGSFRKDVSPPELAHFCVHALSGAHTLPSMAAVRRLVSVTLAGLRPATR